MSNRAGIRWLALQNFFHNLINPPQRHRVDIFTHILFVLPPPKTWLKFTRPPSRGDDPPPSIFVYGGPIARSESMVAPLRRFQIQFLQRHLSAHSQGAEQVIISRNFQSLPPTHAVMDQIKWRGLRGALLRSPVVRWYLTTALDTVILRSPKLLRNA